MPDLNSSFTLYSQCPAMETFFVLTNCLNVIQKSTSGKTHTCRSPSNMKFTMIIAYHKTVTTFAQLCAGKAFNENIDMSNKKKFKSRRGWQPLDKTIARHLLATNCVVSKQTYRLWW